MVQSLKQQAFMRGVRITSKIEGVVLALASFRRWPYPEAVKHLNEKLQQYEKEYRQAEKERNA